MGLLHKVVSGPHVGKLLIKPIGHKNPMANHSAMHIPPSPKPVAPVKRAAKSSGAPRGFKPVSGVMGSGKHASPYQSASNAIHNGGAYSAKHRRL